MSSSFTFVWLCSSLILKENVIRTTFPLKHFSLDMAFIISNVIRVLILFIFVLIVMHIIYKLIIKKMLKNFHHSVVPYTLCSSVNPKYQINRNIKMYLSAYQCFMSLITCCYLLLMLLENIDAPKYFCNTGYHRVITSFISILTAWYHIYYWFS